MFLPRPRPRPRGFPVTGEHTDTAEAVRQARRSLAAIRLEVPSAVHDHHARLVTAALDALVAERDAANQTVRWTKARAETAERDRDNAQRQLDAVDKALPPWETSRPDGIALGRVQTILNLIEDRGERDALRDALREITLTPFGGSPEARDMQRIAARALVGDDTA